MFCNHNKINISKKFLLSLFLQMDRGEKNVQIRFAIIILTFVLALIISGAVSAADNVSNSSGTNILAENATTNTSSSNSLNTSKNSSISNQTLPDPIIEHNGINGTTSYSTIQAAIDAAQAGDTIWLESGTYTTTNDYLNPALVYVTKNLTFRVFNGATATIDGSNLFRCIWVNSGITANFYDVTISNGQSWDPVYLDGAGIFNDRGTVNLYNCILEDNDGLWSGGAIYNNQGTIKLENSTIRNNNVPTKGGAIYNNQGTVNIAGSTITGNSARNGGGIYNDQGTVIIQNSNVNSNLVYDTGENNGGALYNDGGTVSISGCMIWYNNADDNGGAIYNTGNTTITSTNIYSNTAFNGGSIYNTNIGTMTITGSSLYSNLAGNGTAGNPGGNGGAIYNGGTSTLTNCEIHDNQAGNGGNGILGCNGGDGGNGGAIYAPAGTLTVNGGSIYNNHAGNGGSGSVFLLSGGNGGSGGDGGAIYTAATTTINGTEIYSNTAGNGGNGANGADGLGHLIPGYSGGNGGSGGDGGAIYNTGVLNTYTAEIHSNIAGNGGTGGKGGNGVIGLLTHSNGGNGGMGGAGGNAGAIYNSNYLMVTNSSVNSNRSGKGGTGGVGGSGSDQFMAIPSGSGGDGGVGGASGFGAGIYNTGSHLEVISNNLTENFIGTPGNGGAAGLKGYGDGGTNGNAGAAGSSGDGGAFYSTVYVSNPQGLHFNRILNNSAHDVVAAIGVSVSAENNWWGTNFQGTNPSNAGRVSGDVSADPWLMLTVTADSPIYNGKTSQITADLTHNSNNQDTSSQGYIPDGTPVTFALTNGPYGNLAAPLEKYTVNGKISIIFTANDPNAPHTQNINTTVDHQNVTAQILISPLGHVTITKNANTTSPNYHNLVIFTITVTNDGPNNVSGLQVTDLLPAGLSFDSANTHGFGTYAPGNGIWNIGTLNNGATATLTLVANVTTTGSITNWANVTSQATHDELSFENASVIINVPAAAYLTVNKEFRLLINGPAVTHAYYGNTIWTILQAWNNGPDGAWAIIKDTPHAGLNLSNSGWYYSTDGGATWNSGNSLYSIYNPSTHEWKIWIPGISESSLWCYLAIPTQVTKTGTLTNEVGQTWQNVYAPEPFDYNTVNLNVPRQADVYVQIILSKNHLTVGESIVTTVKVGNNGPDTAQGVIVSYTVPEGFKFVGATADVGNPVYNPVTRTVIWNIGDVLVGDPYMHVVMKAVSSGTFKSTAEIIHETTYDPNTKNKAYSAVITVQSPKHPVPDVKPSNKTIPLRHTGLPFVSFLLAVLAVFTGLAMPKRKN